MSLQSLLLSQDPGVLASLPMLLKDTGISVEVHTNGDFFPAAMAERKVDTILVDFETPAAGELVSSARLKHKGAILAVALTNDSASAREALKAGATLVLSKPLTRDRVLSGLRITRNLAIQERRKTIRIPLQTEMSFAVNGGKPQRGLAMNVNQGGIGFRMEQVPKVGQVGELRFTLAGTDRQVIATAEVRWNDSDKKVGGFRFLRLFDGDQLARWIAAKCDGALGGSSNNPQITYR
jgi:CheY-like chemotaxis protein